MRNDSSVEMSLLAGGVGVFHEGEVLVYGNVFRLMAMRHEYSDLYIVLKIEPSTDAPEITAVLTASPTAPVCTIIPRTWYCLCKQFYNIAELVQYCKQSCVGVPSLSFHQV